MSHVTDSVAVCTGSASKQTLCALRSYAGRRTDNAFTFINTDIHRTADITCGVATNKLPLSKWYGKQMRRTKSSHLYGRQRLSKFCKTLADTQCALRQSNGRRTDNNQNCRNVTEAMAAQTGRTLWLLCSPTGSATELSPVILEAICSTRHHCTNHPSGEEARSGGSERPHGWAPYYCKVTLLQSSSNRSRSHEAGMSK